MSMDYPSRCEDHMNDCRCEICHQVKKVTTRLVCDECAKPAQDAPGSILTGRALCRDTPELMETGVSGSKPVASAQSSEKRPYTPADSPNPPTLIPQDVVQHRA